MEELKLKLDKSIDTILNMYSDKKIDLPYKPTIYFGIDDFMSGAMINNKLFNRDYYILTYISELKNELFNFYSGKIEEKKLFEELDLQINLTITKNNDSDIKEHIVLYSQFYKLDFLQMQLTLAHEIWHLIEIENKVDIGYYSILEGTASYAEKYIFNEEIKYPNKKITFQSYRYNYIPYILEGLLSEKKDHLNTLLDLDFRKRFQKIVEPEFKSLLIENISKIIFKKIDKKN